MPIVTIDDEQEKKIIEWYDNHECEKEITHPFLGKIKGALWYCVTSASGIGLNVEGRCDCGQKIDVSDYDSW